VNSQCYAVVGIDRETGTKKVYFKAQPNNQNELFRLVEQHQSKHTLRILCGGAIGGGKGLALDTPLPTPTGWTLMGEIQVGEALYDELGVSCTVTEVSAIHDRSCYRITFSDGATLIADDEHRWVTTTWSERVKQHKRNDAYRQQRRATRPRRGRGLRESLVQRNQVMGHDLLMPPTGTVRTTEELRATLRHNGHERNHAIAVAGPLECKDRHLAIDPYVLGVWLGDGATDAPTLACAEGDAETIEQVRLAGYPVKKYRTAPGKCGAYGIGGDFHGGLHAYDLLGHKRIPSDYLRAAIDQRLALLQGLMDTDGTVTHGGHCELLLTNKTLIDDARELIISLGMKVTLREGRATLDGRDIGPKYRLKFVADRPVFRLDRKRSQQKTDGFRGTHRQRYIVAVDPIDSVPTRCIAVDSPSACYLAGESMIPTHNTKVEVGFALWFSQKYPGARIGIGRKDFNDLRDTVYDDFVKMCPPGWIKLPQKGLKDRLEASHRVVFHNKTEIVFLELKDVEGKLGLEFDLIIIDQVEEIVEKTYATMEGRLRSSIDGGEDIPRVMLVGANPNPGFSKTLFYDNAQRPRHPEGTEIPEIDDPRETEEDRAYMRSIGIEPSKVIEPTWLEQYRHPYYHYLHFSPKHNVDLMRKNPHYVSDLESRFPASWVKRYLLGDWDIAVEGAIFQEYDSGIHETTAFVPPASWPRTMSLDPHLARPFVANYHAQCPGGAGFIHAELIGRPEQSTRDFFRMMIAFEAAHWPGGRVGHIRRIIDYSLTTQQHKRNDGRTIKEIIAEFGLTFENARKHNKWDNILLVKEQLKPASGEPALLYTTKNCTETIWQWKNYKWQEHEPGTNEQDQILKERDDCMDNVQYLIATKPWAQVAVSTGPPVSYLPGTHAEDGGAPRIDADASADVDAPVGYGVS